MTEHLPLLGSLKAMKSDHMTEKCTVYTPTVLKEMLALFYI